MTLCHKWDVKDDFAYVLQFFSLISDGLGSVRSNLILEQNKFMNPSMNEYSEFAVQADCW